MDAAPINAPQEVATPREGGWRTFKRFTWYRFLRHLRKLRDDRHPKAPEPECDCRGQEVSDRIHKLLMAPAPCMIARFGNNELRTVENHLAVHDAAGLWTRMNRYLRGESGPWWWDDRTAREMLLGAGFFPATPENLERFARMTLEDSAQVDVLGSWLPAESLVASRMTAVRVPLEQLEPYFHKEPWSRALEHRKVLVIHPFEKSIRLQYEKRRQLFKDPRVLPDFDLKTLRSVQSIGGDCQDFASWFEALDWMKQQIGAIDFEIAIIGAGAYGMPLAAFIKRDLGRKAIHLGGATQILFGIRGRRWDERARYAKKLYNEAWTRPLEEEKPSQAGRVEGGCYW